MSKFNYIQNDFTTGQLGRKLDGRTDLEQYTKGAALIENGFVQRQGGILRRPGAQFVTSFGSNNFPGVSNFDPGRAIPFVVSKTESYLIILNVNGGTTTLGSDGAPVTNALVIVNNLGATANLDVRGIQDNFPSGSTTTGQEVDNWQYAQNGDIMVITYSPGTFPPHFIVRTEENRFKVFCLPSPLVDQQNYRDVVGSIDPLITRAYQDENLDQDVRFYFDATGAGTRTINAVDSNNNPIGYFTSDMVYANKAATNDLVINRLGKHFKFTDGTITATGYITAIVSSTQTFAATSINTSTELITVTSHGFFTGQAVTIENATGDPPITSPNTFVDGETKVYAREVSANTFTLHKSKIGAETDTETINFTAQGTGNVTVTALEVDQATLEALNTLPNSTLSSNATDRWQESAFDQFRGFPKSCTFHEQRLIFGGTPTQPETIFGSLVGNVFHFMERRYLDNTSSSFDKRINFFDDGLNNPVLSTDPFQFTIASNEANGISWIASNKQLQVGTLGTEYIITGANEDEIVSNGSIRISAQTNHGGSPIQPARVNDSLLFVARDGKTIRDFFFSDQVKAYITNNINLFNDEILQSKFGGTADDSFANIGIRSIQFQESRSILWVLTTTNTVVALTLDKDAQVVAWHQHEFGGIDEVRSIASIPNSTGTFDDFYILIKRGNETATLEKIGDDFRHNLLFNNSSLIGDKPIYTDSAVFRRVDNATAVLASSVTTADDTIQVRPELLTTTQELISPGTKIRVTTTDTLPSPLVIDTDYFVGWQSLTEIVLTEQRSDALAYVPFYDFTDTEFPGGDVITTGTGHLYQTGQKIQLATTGALPSPLATSTDYFVIRNSSTNIKLATSLANAQAGTAITISAASGGGTHSISGPDNNVIDLTTQGVGTHTITEQASTWFFINHLAAGTEVQVVADGKVFPNETILEWAEDSTAGVLRYIQLNNNDEKIEVVAGLPYDTTIQTLRLEAGGDFGSAQGQVKAIDRLTLRFFKTFGAQFGYDLTDLEEVLFLPDTYDVDTQLPIFTGDKVIEYRSDADRLGQVYVLQKEPLPWTLSAIVMRGVTFD